MKKSFFHAICAGFLALIFFSCSTTEEEVVNIYTHRHYAADQELFARFTELTGIKVNVVNASADELIQKLELEGANSPADILITVDAGRLHRAEEKGLFQPFESEIIERKWSEYDSWIDEFTPLQTSIVPAIPGGDTIITQLRDNLLEDIRRVRESKDYIPQAKQACNTTNTLLNLVKIQIQMNK